MKSVKHWSDVIMRTVMVLNVNSMLERLHVQSVSDQLYLDESLDDYGEVVAEENDTLTYNNPVIDKVMEDSGVEGFRTLQLHYRRVRDDLECR
ncbi:hypothetical protein DYB28_004507 [Aphanomyces astaci]|uniref:Uncharacterized protein n=1 Tax=Aphanomyces astaci TaxID=112090 RepID=A0A9X8H6K8_APHAT|nr:hypothetical protein DYB28_004507 [Aphanomyces astaci]